MLDGEEVVGFERDALHREVHRSQANGLEQTQTYDPMGRLTSQLLKARDLQVPDMDRWRHKTFGERMPGSRLDEPASLLRQYRYDKGGHLSDIHDSRRGMLSYRYDPVGRLFEASSSRLGTEYFAFAPAGNMSVGSRVPEHVPTVSGRPEGPPPAGPSVLDNLLKD